MTAEEQSRRDYRGSRQILQDDLAVLRAELKETLQSFAVRVDGDVARIADLLAEEDGAINRAEVEGRLKCMKRTRTFLAELDVKPRKGRAKDLKRLEETVDRLKSLVADW